MFIVFVKLIPPSLSGGRNAGTYQNI